MEDIDSELLEVVQFSRELRDVYNKYKLTHNELLAIDEKFPFYQNRLHYISIEI